jgi:hypothetical protein
LRGILSNGLIEHVPNVDPLYLWGITTIDGYAVNAVILILNVREEKVAVPDADVHPVSERNPHK